MNIFNKIVVILIVLTGMILIPLILIFPEQAELVLRTAADVVALNIEWLNSLAWPWPVVWRALLAIAGVAVFLVGLLFLALEVVPKRRKTVRLRDGSGELMMDGVSGHLAYYVDALPDVLRVRPDVVSKGKTVRASLYVETAPNVNVPAKSAEIKEEARRVIEDQLGLDVKGQIQVIIRPVAYPKGERAPRPVSSVTEPVQEEAAQPITQEPAQEEEKTEPAEEQGDSQIIEAKEPSS
jgi:uncharacterized alkaline shock family protein YloU